jgi:hypothetical protein
LGCVRTKVMREQDQQLSEVHQTVGVLKTLGEAISTELEDQAECASLPDSSFVRFFHSHDSLV